MGFFKEKKEKKFKKRKRYKRWVVILGSVSQGVTYESTTVQGDGLRESSRRDQRASLNRLLPIRLATQ